MSECEYCREFNDTIKTVKENIELEILGKDLMINIYDEDITGSLVNINYCPMCGRKLGLDNE